MDDEPTLTMAVEGTMRDSSAVLDEHELKRLARQMKGLIETNSSDDAVL